MADLADSLKGVSEATGVVPPFELCGELENEALERRMDSVLVKFGELQARV